MRKTYIITTHAKIHSRPIISTTGLVAQLPPGIKL